MAIGLHSAGHVYETFDSGWAEGCQYVACAYHRLCVHEEVGLNAVRLLLPDWSGCSEAVDSTAADYLLKAEALNLQIILEVPALPGSWSWNLLADMFEQFTTGNRLMWLSRSELHTYHTLDLVGFSHGLSISFLLHLNRDQQWISGLICKSIFHSHCFFSGRWLLCKLLYIPLVSRCHTMSFREIGLVTQGKPYEDWLRSLARSVSLMKCVTWRWRSNKGWKRFQEAEAEPNFIHLAIPQLEIIHQDVQQVAWGHGCSFAQDSRSFSGCWFGGCFASGWTHTGHSLDGRVSGNHHVRHHHFQETFQAGEGPQAFRFVGRCRKSFDWMLSWKFWTLYKHHTRMATTCQRHAKTIAIPAPICFGETFPGPLRLLLAATRRTGRRVSRSPLPKWPGI